MDFKYVFLKLFSCKVFFQSATCSWHVEEKGRKYDNEVVWLLSWEHPGISLTSVKQRFHFFFLSQLTAHQAIFSTLICLSGVSFTLELVDGLRAMISFFFFFFCGAIMLFLTHCLCFQFGVIFIPLVGALPEFGGQTFLRDVSSGLVPSPP